jgi:hypothetical protein
MEPTKATRTIEHVIRLLVARDYEALLLFAPSPGINANDLRSAAAQYFAQLIFPPIALEQLMNVVEVLNLQPKTWYVGIDMWTQEEGRSDLTLEMHFQEAAGDFYSVKIDGLHVL